MPCSEPLCLAVSPEHEDLLREMGAMNTKPTSETYLLRKQLEKLQTDMRQERAVQDQERAAVERRLTDEQDRNQELLRRLEEQTFTQRDLLKELKDNRQSLVHHKVGQSAVVELPLVISMESGVLNKYRTTFKAQYKTIKNCFRCID